MKTPRSLLALTLGLLGFGIAHASAQTVINSVPYNIIASGHYVLGGNLNSSSYVPPASISDVMLIWSHQCGPAGAGGGVATGRGTVGAINGERAAIGS